METHIKRDIFERLSDIISTSPKIVVLEMGMCDGFHTNLMLNIIKQTGKPFVYHGFEPNADLMRAIESHTALHKGTFNVFDCAVGNFDGVMPFYKSDNKYYGSSSIRKPKLVFEAWKDMSFTEHTIKVVKMDTHLKRFGLENEIIDFIWADVQGAEVDLIAGGENSWKNVRYFYTEYCDSELYEGEIGLKQICAMLPDFEIVEDYGGDVLLKNKNL
jgi:FkbM family methyltransferase